MQSTLGPLPSHARSDAPASISSTRIRYYHNEQIQGFITQRLYDSQQELLRNYFFPGRVEKRIRFGLGLDECVPWMPAFPFLTQTGRDWNAAMTELRLEHIIKHVDLDMSHHIGMAKASHGAQNIFLRTQTVSSCQFTKAVQHSRSRPAHHQQTVSKSMSSRSHYINRLSSTVLGFRQ